MNIHTIQSFSRDSAGIRRRILGPAAMLVFAGLLFGAATASAQQERLHQVTWTHTGGGVSRFVVLVSPEEGSLAGAREVEVGLPEGQLIGETVNLYSAMISFGEDEYLAIAAVGENGMMSVPSNWKGMPPTRPGQPLLVEP